MTQFDKSIFNFLLWISLKDKYSGYFLQKWKVIECYMFRINVSLVFFIAIVILIRYRIHLLTNILVFNWLRFRKEYS